MSNKIFVITNFQGIVSFYADLEKAKNELKNIHDTTHDFKHYSYEINVYIFIDNTYINTDEKYIYYLDNFIPK